MTIQTALMIVAGLVLFYESVRAIQYIAHIEAQAEYVRKGRQP